MLFGFVAQAINLARAPSLAFPHITPAGWLRLGSRTQSSLRRSRRVVPWSSPCHPQGFFAGVTPEPGCPPRGTGRENPGRESLNLFTVFRPLSKAHHSTPEKPAPTSTHHS